MASPTDAWSLILAKRFDEALAYYDSRRATWQPRDWREYGGRATVLMCLRRYEEASSELMLGQNLSQIGGAASEKPFSDILGGALWLAGKRDEALAEWEIYVDGLLDGSITYSDASGGTGNAMLLRFGALTMNDQRRLDKCGKLLKRLITKSRIKSWPGPLAFFALEKKSMPQIFNEQYGESQVDLLLARTAQDYLLLREMSQALFHWSFDERQKGDTAKAVDLLHACVACENYLEVEWFLGRELLERKQSRSALLN